MNRLALALAVGLAAISAAAPAGAQSDADKATARSAYTRGMDLREQGKVTEALTELRSAHALFPTPITGLELGRTLVLLGRVIEGREVLLSIARLPVRANESAKATSARAEAAGLAEQVARRIAEVKVSWSPVAENATVRIDDVNVDPRTLDVPRKVDPGTHTVEVRSSAGAGRATLSLADGETRAVEIALVPSAAGPAPPPPSSAAPEVPRRGLGPVFWTGAVTAGVAAVVGGVSLGLALSNVSAARSQCENNLCPPPVHANVDAAKTWSAVSTVSAIGFAVGVTVSVLGILTRPSERASPAIGVRADGLEIRF